MANPRIGYLSVCAVVVVALMTEAAPIQDRKIQDPTVQEPVIQDPTVKDPTIKNSMIKDPTIQDPMIKDLTIQEPAIKDPMIQEPAIKDPQIKDPTIKNPAIKDQMFKDPTIQRPAIKDPQIKDSKIQEPTIQEPTTQDLTTQDPTIENPVKMDLLFIVDGSAGVGGAGEGERQFHRFKRSMKTTVRNFPAVIDRDNARIAMVMFSDKAETRVVFHLDHTFDKEKIIETIDNVKYTGQPGRMMGKALRLAKEKVFIPERGAREDAHQLVFLMTTGPSDDREDVLKYAGELRKSGVEIFATGISVHSTVDKEELSSVVSAPPEAHLYIIQVGP